MLNQKVGKGACVTPKPMAKRSAPIGSESATLRALCKIWPSSRSQTGKVPWQRGGFLLPDGLQQPERPRNKTTMPRKNGQGKPTLGSHATLTAKAISIRLQSHHQPV
jgi:hypothetical protein